MLLTLDPQTLSLLACWTAKVSEKLRRQVSSKLWQKKPNPTFSRTAIQRIQGLWKIPS
jgi:hypothetical protein